MTKTTEHGSVGTMKLNEWLRQEGMVHRAFAERLGISKAMLSLMLSGKRRPGRELAVNIEAVTKGKVKVKEWAEPTTK